jgi:hypothetical protein
MICAAEPCVSLEGVRKKRRIHQWSLHVTLEASGWNACTPHRFGDGNTNILGSRPTGSKKSDRKRSRLQTVMQNTKQVAVPTRSKHRHSAPAILVADHLGAHDGSQIQVLMHECFSQCLDDLLLSGLWKAAVEGPQTCCASGRYHVFIYTLQLLRRLACERHYAATAFWGTAARCASCGCLHVSLQHLRYRI